jgi:hypothetical protein
MESGEDEDAAGEGQAATRQRAQAAGNSDRNQQQPPETMSSPITNHFDAVLECLDFLQSAEEDEQVDKLEVVQALRGRMHNMLSKVLLGNTITSMSMLGWRLE